MSRLGVGHPSANFSPSGIRNYSESVQWTNNPAYISPEHAGISWYDQVEHFNPESEGLVSYPQGGSTVTFAEIEDSLPHPEILTTQRNIEARAAANSAQAISAPAPPPPVAPATNSGVVGELARTAGIESAQNTNRILNTTAEGLASGAQAAEGVLSLVPGPGTAALITSLAGNATADILGASRNSSIANDYLHNVKQQGAESTFQASLIRDMEQIRQQNMTAGAKIGGIFGPLGALLGGLLTDVIQGTPTPNSTYNDYKTSYSFDGKFNPQDTGAVNSGTTSDLSGQSNLNENV